MEEGDDGWETFAKGVKKLPKKALAAVPIPKLVKPTPHKQKNTFTSPASWLHGSPLSAESVSSAIDGSTAEKLKRGKFTIDGRLDLHGYTADAAYTQLIHFISNGFMQGKRCLLVITGKGLRPDGSHGIIRESVPKWLNEPDMRQYILAFRYAKTQDGGEGALYVLLRRKR